MCRNRVSQCERQYLDEISILLVHYYMFSPLFQDFLMFYASNLPIFSHLFHLDQQQKPLFMPSRRARSGNYAVYRSLANKLAETAILPVHFARRRRKVDAAAADPDEDNKEGEVLEVVISSGVQNPKPSPLAHKRTPTAFPLFQLLRAFLFRI